jgi:hypothetical protein
MGRVADGGRSIVESVVENDENIMKLCTKDAIEWNRHKEIITKISLIFLFVS